jgi:ligand-binding sensor domain-containing protein
MKGEEWVGIQTIAITENHIWCGMPRNGIYQYNLVDRSFSFMYFIESNVYKGNVTDIEIDHSGNIWFGIYGSKEIVMYNGSKWITYIPEFPTVTDIAVDSFGVIWIASVDYGTDNYHFDYALQSYDGKEWKTHLRYYDDTNYSNMFMSLGFDVRGNIYLGCKSSKVFIYDKKTVVELRDENLPRGHVKRIARDRNGILWFAAQSSLNSYNPDTGQWKMFTWPNLPEGLGGANDVAVDQNNIVWFPTDRGLLSFNGRDWQVHRYDSAALDDNNFRSVAIGDDGSIWTHNQTALFQLKPTVTPVRVEDASPLAFGITGIRPNPFNPNTSISFTISEPGRVHMAVYSVTGQKVRELVSENRNAGMHSVMWDGHDEQGKAVSSGVYIARMETDGKASAARMLMVR